ncbi:alpha/beta fold hydrolase [Ruania zhangjianzhongii]|uniref:alpha/beta fold hydrolase n=1 Tax=Ruania zhangjianzhongii TaxID=2603206 RepID=UPI0011C8D3B7|nr:alpha/beta hydrolase [Ruania zhangjianzhongii]
MDSAPVLLVHGIRSSSTMWRPVQPLLDRAGIRHAVIDLPGHGRRRGEEFTIAACREAIEEGMAGLGGEAVVAGLSLGGFLSLNWAARTANPPLAVLAASCSVRPRGLPLWAYQLAAQVFAQLPDEGRAVNDLMARLVLGEDSAADLNEDVAFEVMVPALRAMAAVHPLEDLARIKVPVWLVNGTWDHFRIEERAFLDAVQYGRLVKIPRAGHIITAHQPEIFARVVVQLARLSQEWKAHPRPVP